MQLSIPLIAFQQFRMRPLGCDTPLVQHDDMVHPVQIHQLKADSLKD
jgi:hypothetical protein